MTTPIDLDGELYDEPIPDSENPNPSFGEVLSRVKNYILKNISREEK